jgi:hypothetical protein
MANSAVPSKQWVKTGLDFVKDGLWGRLGVQENFGSTWIAGAINGLAVHENAQNGKTLFYAGSVNGGVYLRTYDRQTDQWDESWQPLSRPGSGYEGSQSITQLAVSDDGHYLAVGQGAASNWGHVAAPSQGVQIGRIESDGSVTWLPNTDAAKAELTGLDISSLHWNGNTLIASSWNSGIQEIISQEKKGGSLLTIQTDQGGISAVSRQHIGSNNPILDNNGVRTLAGTSNKEDQSNALILDGSVLSGDTYQNYLASLEAEGAFINRISLYEREINGKLIAFIGSVTKDDSGNVYIKRIDRLEIDPETHTLTTFSLFSTKEGDIGDNQAGNDPYFGNFSLKADPHDPQGMSVFAAGNHFMNSNISPSVAPDGGLVRVDFRDNKPQITSFLYGSRMENNQLVTPFSPGAPHADSRSIAFYEDANGPVIVETDDGGIWHLKLDRTPNGAVASEGAWWTPLNGAGLTSFEVNEADWSSRANSVANSYQDNAASLGYFGESYATNFFTGDGQVAFVDDANEKHSYKAYLSTYYWLFQDKPWVFVEYDRDGFIKDRGNARFYLKQGTEGKLAQWPETSEVKNTTATDTGYKPFDSPHEENAYRSKSISFAGLYNIYETIDTPQWFNDPNALVVRKLLKGGDVSFLKPTAIDNQGTRTAKPVDSLYVAAVLADPDTGEARENLIYGRQSTNQEHRFKLKPLKFSNLTSSQMILDGVVIDVAHKSSAKKTDTVYWLQGGTSIAYKNVNDVGNHNASDQVLRVGEKGGKVQTYRLSSLGLPITQDDYYGAQSLAFVPETDNHPDLLIIAGLNGIWASKLDRDGQPKQFKPMSWLDFPDSTGPGSYVKHVRYNPQDDLLIAATQGQGSFIYSFSGDLKQRARPKQLLHVANAHLYQSPDPALDKRGNEVNNLISIALDSRIQSKSKPTPVTVTLHNATAWRNAMEMVSAYNNGIDPSISSDPSQEKFVPVYQYFNILNPLGLEIIGGSESNGDILFPLVFDPGVSLFNLQINAEETDAQSKLPPLQFSVSTEDGAEVVTRKIKFVSDSLINNKKTSKRSSKKADPVTGLSDDAAELRLGLIAQQSTGKRNKIGSRDTRDLITNSTDQSSTKSGNMLQTDFTNKQSRGFTEGISEKSSLYHQAPIVASTYQNTLPQIWNPNIFSGQNQLLSGGDMQFMQP